MAYNNRYTGLPRVVYAVTYTIGYFVGFIYGVAKSVFNKTKTALN